jgi:hypothetical protein
MRQQLCAGAVALALIAGIGTATAQRAPGTPQLNLSQQQEQTISNGLAGQQSQAAQPGVGDVGSRLPSSVQHQPMPSNVGAQVPEAQKYHFAKLPDRILLVDPENQMIVEIIPVTTTTGTTPGSPAR